MPDPKRLAGTLSPPARRALERAAERALREMQAAVEPEHLLLELCRGQDNDLVFLAREGQLDLSRITTGLDRSSAAFRAAARACRCCRTS